MAKELAESAEHRLQQWLKGELKTGELFDLTPDAMHALAEHGYLLYDQGKYETAKRIYEALAAIDAENPNYQRMLGSIYQLQGKWDVAYYHYSACLRTASDDIFVLTNRGEVLLRLGRKQEAAEDFRKAILTDPRGEHPAARRARILIASLNLR